MNIDDKVYKIEGYNIIEKYLFELLEDYNYYIDKKTSEIKTRYIFLEDGLWDNKKSKFEFKSNDTDHCKIMFMNLLYPAYEMFTDNWTLYKHLLIDTIYKNILKDLDDSVLNNDEILNIEYFCEKYSEFIDVNKIKNKIMV